MNKNLKKIMLLKLTFVTLTTYVNIFINYFFWELTGDFKSVILFGTIQWIFWMIPYSAGTFLLTINPRFNYYISAFSALLTFTFLWAFSNSLSPFILMILVACFTTAISAFFYSSNTVALLNAANSKEINRFISLEGSLTNLLAFVMPIVNGAIIYFLGFSWSFSFMLVVSLFYFYLTLTSTNAGKVEWHSLKKSMKTEKFTLPMIMYNFIAIFASRGTLLFGTILLIFVSANELQMSLWNALSVAVIFLLAFVIRKFPSIRVATWSKLSLVPLFLACLVIFLEWNLVFVIALQAVAVYLCRYAEISLPLKLIHRADGEGKIALTYKREFIINNARIFMTILWFVVYHFVSLETLFLLILGSSILSILFVSWLGAKIEKIL